MAYIRGWHSTASFNKGSSRIQLRSSSSSTTLRGYFSTSQFADYTQEDTRSSNLANNSPLLSFVLPVCQTNSINTENGNQARKTRKLGRRRKYQLKVKPASSCLLAVHQACQDGGNVANAKTQLIPPSTTLHVLVATRNVTSATSPPPASQHLFETTILATHLPKTISTSSAIHIIALIAMPVLTIRISANDQAREAGGGVANALGKSILH